MSLSLLPTPVASDATTGAIVGKNDRFVTTGNGTLRKINRNGKDGSVGLARMVKLLPTPSASEGEKYAKRYNPDSQMGKGLAAMAASGMLPDREETAPGSDPRGETSQLNPRYVAEMMGFPPDWTVSPFLSGEPSP